MILVTGGAGFIGSNLVAVLGFWLGFLCNSLGSDQLLLDAVDSEGHLVVAAVLVQVGDEGDLEGEHQAGHGLLRAGGRLDAQLQSGERLVLPVRKGHVPLPLAVERRGYHRLCARDRVALVLRKDALNLLVPQALQPLSMGEGSSESIKTGIRFTS